MEYLEVYDMTRQSCFVNLNHVCTIEFDNHAPIFRLYLSDKEVLQCYYSDMRGSKEHELNFKAYTELCKMTGHPSAYIR